MERLGPRALTNGHGPVSSQDGIVLRPNDAASAVKHNLLTDEYSRHNSPPYLSTLSSPSSPSQPIDDTDFDGIKPSRDNCDTRRPDEDGASRLPSMAQQLMGQTAVQPYLKEYIPSNYAPMSGKVNLLAMANSRTIAPSSKVCYRHRPDSKCRKAADESKMSMIQKVRLVGSPCGVVEHPD